MSDSQTILEHIHGLLGDKEAEVAGTLLLDGEQLSVRDGELLLRVEILPDQGRRTAATMVHAHVIATLTDYKFRRDDVTRVELPACIVGIDRVHKMALFDVARVWVDLVAGPVFSLMMGTPVFDAERLELPETPWSPGCEGWVGPVGFRFAETAAESKIGQAPVFQDATRLANPQSVHLAKATLDGAAGPDWHFTLEMNGHEASYSDQTWNGVGEPTHGGIAIRFATFHHLAEVDWVEKRIALDEAIVNYVQLHADDSIADVDEQFSRQTHDQDLATQISIFVMSACARIIFDGQVKSWTDVFYYVRPGGILGEPRRLLSEPTFARAMGLRSVLTNEENLKGLKRCAMRSCEANTLNNALLQGSQPADLVLLPIVIPTECAGESDIQLAVQQLVAQFPKKQKPWWRFW